VDPWTFTNGLLGFGVLRCWLCHWLVLDRWKKEKWQDIGGKDYPVYRPTKRVSKDTPLTASEIDPDNLKKQIKLKQEIRGDYNLPKFIRGTGVFYKK